MKLIKTDTDFADWARKLQIEWRLENNFPIGTYKQKQKDKSYLEVELGNYIEKQFAFENKSNFLTSNIKYIVETALKNKEKGARITRTRLYTNLLSSQPMAFNLFGELALDYNLATIFFQRQFGNRINKVVKIIFEHSDGRGNCSYTCDHSAFDVFVEYTTENNRLGFIAFEVKYSECLDDKPAKYKKRYYDLTIKSKLFKANTIEFLKTKPIEQIWRDHLLSLAHLYHPNKKYEDGFFVYLFPEKNKECKMGLDRYIENFVSYEPITKTYDEETTRFYKRDLKDFVLDLKAISNANWIDRFLNRYFGNEPAERSKAAANNRICASVAEC